MTELHLLLAFPARFVLVWPQHENETCDLFSF
jgi:hypothetical protein